MNKTPLYDFHLRHAAKMTEFAGYALPLQYSAGLLAEHRHTRAACSLFDVSHMGQLRIGAAAAQKLAPIDALQMPPGAAKYTLLLNENGGVVDDTIISREEDGGFIAVVNAARKAAVLAHFEKHLPSGEKAQTLDDALLSLSGPTAAAVMEKIAPAACALRFMQCAVFDVGGEKMRISRSGYTGEDGFEIAAPPAAADTLAEQLLTAGEVAPAGLGARDSLRLEAGLPLYGNELREDVTPTEAGLLWAVSKKRIEEGGFVGCEAAREFSTQPPTRKLIALQVSGASPVRAHAPLFAAEDGGEVIGEVTSGLFSPVLSHPIALAFVKSAFAKTGAQLFAELRKRRVACEIVKPPFVPHRYFRG